MIEGKIVLHPLRKTTAQYENNGFSFLIKLAPSLRKNKKEMFSSLIHELTHLAVDLCQISLSPKDEETLCRLMEEKALEFLEKVKEK